MKGKCFLLAAEVLQNEKVMENIIKGVKCVFHGVKKTYGFIHKREEAEVNGKRGFLIWDYVVYNEITFKSDEDSTSFSFFHSLSDKKTEIEWNKLIEKYGI